MPLRFKLQLVVMSDDNEVCVDDVVVLDKQPDRVEHFGLNRNEAKMLLAELQRQVLSRAPSSCRWGLVGWRGVSSRSFRTAIVPRLSLPCRDH
jgi:hypothetical protein